jgi:hypothetical protein
MLSPMPEKPAARGLFAALFQIQAICPITAVGHTSGKRSTGVSGFSIGKNYLTTTFS